MRFVFDSKERAIFFFGKNMQQVPRNPKLQPLLMAHVVDK